MSHRKKSPEFYEYYPKLFHDYYSEVDTSIVRILSEVGQNYYSSILDLESIIDNKEFHKIFNVLNLQEVFINSLPSSEKLYNV